MKTFYLLLSSIWMMNAICIPGNAEEVVFRSPEGELMVLQVTPEDSFIGVLQKIQNQILAQEESGELNLEMTNSEYVLDFMASLDKTAVGKGSTTRSYEAGLSSQDQKDITYIITTLGNSSLVKIAKERSSLKKAGDRIAHVHPFWFVMGIFLDEKTKAAMHNLVNRSWVYDEFFKGLRTSLDEESAKSNLKPEYIQDFAARLNIDPSAIIPALNDKRWQTLVDILIKLVPRSGNPGRYDM